MQSAEVSAWLSYDQAFPAIFFHRTYTSGNLPLSCHGTVSLLGGESGTLAELRIPPAQGSAHA